MKTFVVISLDKKGYIQAEFDFAGMTINQASQLGIRLDQVKKHLLDVIDVNFKKKKLIEAHQIMRENNQN